MNEMIVDDEGHEMCRQMAQYYAQESAALQNRYAQIERLIGTNHHNPSVGYHCEEILRNWLIHALPRNQSVSTGFVRGNPYTNSSGKLVTASPQVDILIHDSANYGPIYQEGNLTIALPDAVKAVIEVKKSLTT